MRLSGDIAFWPWYVKWTAPLWFPVFLLCAVVFYCYFLVKYGRKETDSVCQVHNRRP